MLADAKGGDCLFSVWAVPPNLDQDPFYTARVSVAYVVLHPVGTQDMARHFHHDIVRFHAGLAFVARPALQAGRADGQHFDFAFVAVGPDQNGRASCWERVCLSWEVLGGAGS